MLSKPVPKSATKDLGAHEVKVSLYIRPFSELSPGTRTDPDLTTKQKITINCEDPIKDRIFQISEFETFLKQKVKVDSRTGNLTDQVVISTKNGNVIEIVSKDKVEPPSGRYIKYLTKKHLKKMQLRDWIRVTSTSQCNYKLKFFNVQGEDDAEDDDEDDA